jgi:hypothetical protein
VKPVRVQRKRTKGWRMPENTVYVGRGSRWGNPWREGDTAGWTIQRGGVIVRAPHEPLTREQAIASFRNAMEWTLEDKDYEGGFQAALAGKNLACWCPLDQPCHADVLLELANVS